MSYCICGSAEIKAYPLLDCLRLGNMSTMLDRIPHLFPRSISCDSCLNRNIQTDSVLIKSHVFDTTDNPALQKLLGKPFASEDEVFKVMKYECNRLYSFKDNWPVKEIKPKILAEAGLFYLQREDRVQCPFCHVVLYHWTSADNPLREHIKKSPKCSFLKGSHDCGNVPLLASHKIIPKKPVLTGPLSTTKVDYKPKHPGLADIKKRLLTYSEFPYPYPEPRALAECGLYYSGVADVVTCFFCGGSLGNWESTDDPWEEHKKFFPDCAFLTLAATRNMRTFRTVQSCKAQSLAPPMMNGVKEKSPDITKEKSPDITTDILQEALHIFPKPLVMDAIERKGGSVNSLEELCDDILSSKSVKTESPPDSPPSQTNSSNAVESAASSYYEPLLCKICMDKDREVVFEPCGHLVSCWNCAKRIRDCPVCRKPIQHVLRTYFS